MKKLILKSSKNWQYLPILLILLTTTSAEQLERDRFQKIPQPLVTKVLVTLGGVSLIGAELWWFIWSKKS